MTILYCDDETIYAKWKVFEAIVRIKPEWNNMGLRQKSANYSSSVMMPSIRLLVVECEGETGENVVLWKKKGLSHLRARRWSQEMFVVG
jgi:hypothetical protein